MNTILNAINQVSQKAPNAPAIRNNDLVVNYDELLNLVDKASIGFSDTNSIGLMLDNSLAWVVLDLACLKLQVNCVPIPNFFSEGQILHTIIDSGIDTLVTDQPDRLEYIFATAYNKIVSRSEIRILGKSLTKFDLINTTCNIPTQTVKITYTSGTTGQPKGVCLSEQAILNVAYSLKQVTAATNSDVHLCILPLATLLENIAGVYVPLIVGACIYIPSLTEVGFSASTQVNFYNMLQVIYVSQASTLIITPELLRGLIDLKELREHLPIKLRFVAVGGALVPKTLLTRARELGVPAYEGYGLSECASVVSLNSPLASSLGSVGKPLPHIKLLIKENGEILVKGSQFLGYSNHENLAVEDYLATGDIGYIDDEGYLYITGRKKNIFITSYGRNVSPEWVERELTSNQVIIQAAVFGEARPYNLAVIVSNPTASYEAIEAAIHKANQNLPEYAKVQSWVLADTAFTYKNGLSTSNLRLKRAEIYQQYRSVIETIYNERSQLVL